MSYILSALKKVERKRRSEPLPDLLSIHVESAPTRAGGGRRALFKTVAVTGLLVALGGWLLLPASGSRTPGWLADQWASLPFSRWLQPVISSDSARHETASAGEAVYRTVEVREFSPPSGSVAQAPATARPPALAAPSPRPAPAGTLRAAALPVHTGPVDFDSLPPDTRRRIPVFSVTGHLYSNARPQANKVIINGAALREGQYVSEDLMVSEITGDGVVMDFRGLQFRIGTARIFQ